jgi:hypothetical protein
LKAQLLFTHGEVHVWRTAAVGASETHPGQAVCASSFRMEVARWPCLVQDSTSSPLSSSSQGHLGSRQGHLAPSM